MGKKPQWVRDFTSSIDMYAPAVGLAYNGSKKHHTVPGALCTILSILLIAFQMYTTWLKYSDPEYTNVIRNNHELMLSQTEPPVFEINKFQLSLMNRIQTSDLSILDNDQYYSGIYRQTYYNVSTNTTHYKYIENVPCSYAFRGATNLSAQMVETLPYMNCMDAESFDLQGSSDLDGTPM